MFNNNIYLFFNFLIVVLYCWGVTGIHVDHPGPEVKMHKRNDLSHWGGKAIYLNKMPQKENKLDLWRKKKPWNQNILVWIQSLWDLLLKMCKGWLEALEWKSHLENVLFQQNTVKRRQASYVREFKIKTFPLEPIGVHCFWTKLICRTVFLLHKYFGLLGNLFWIAFQLIC